jgi:hypothetical protein
VRANGSEGFKTRDQAIFFFITRAIVVASGDIQPCAVRAVELQEQRLIKGKSLARLQNFRAM